MTRPRKPYKALSLLREQDHFWDWRTRGKREKKKKKAKMADCTQTPLKKGLNTEFYQAGWYKNQSPAFSQALLILLFHLQSHMQTPPTKQKRERKEKSGQSVWIGTSSLAANDADRVVTSDLSPTPLTKFAQLISAAWHWWTFNLMMPVPHTLNTSMTAGKSLTETQHMHTHNLQNHESECNTPI